LLRSPTQGERPMTTAICSPTADGYVLRVVGDTASSDLVRVDLDWEEFRPASAGHRLIENGWMIRPDARGPETVNGWRETPTAAGHWSVPVVSTAEAVG
jgi:hypothetical protein